MTYAAEDEEEPPPLRRLRLLVMVLMVVLILGIVTIAATIVIRLGFGGGPPAATAVEAAAFTVPEGEIVGLGRGEGTVLMVVRGADGVERLYVFDRKTGGAALSVSVMERE